MQKLLLFLIFLSSYSSFSNDELKESLVQQLAKTTNNDSSIIILDEIIRIKDNVEEFEYWLNYARPYLAASKNDSLILGFRRHEASMRFAYFQYESGMELFQEIKKTAEDNDDSLSLFEVNYRIATHYFFIGENALSLDYMKESLALMPSYADLKKRANVEMALGTLYAENGFLEEGINHQIIALEIKRENQDWAAIPISLNNLSESYLKDGDTIKSLAMVDRSIFLADSLEQKASFAYANFLKGELLQYKKNYTASIPYLETSIRWWEEKDRTSDLPRAYARILISYKGLNEQEKTINTLEKYMALKDTLFNLKGIEASKNIEAKYNTEKKELQLSKEREEKEWAEKENILIKKNEKQNFFIFLIVSLFLILSIIYLYIRFKNQRRDKNTILDQKSLIEARSQEIEDSINYAKRLQSAIMPTVDAVKASFESAFVLYMPKDIVAGDFYWMDQVEETILIAAADCTGHGVPGAMVSVVCTNGLNSAVRQHDLIEPNKILDKTREIVVGQFAKSGENVKDGMDIALCAIKNGKLKFAGANNPLWIIRKIEHVSTKDQQKKGNMIGEGHVLLETKGDKQPIGFSDHQAPFKQTEIQLLDDDIVYLLTDGYADQFGGLNEGVTKVDGKKLKYSRLKKLLLTNCQRPFDQQYEILADTFDAWKGSLEQLDDVCIIGFTLP